MAQGDTFTLDEAYGSAKPGETFSLDEAYGSPQTAPIDHSADFRLPSYSRREAAYLKALTQWRNANAEMLQRAQDVRPSGEFAPTGQMPVEDEPPTEAQMAMANQQRFAEQNPNLTVNQPIQPQLGRGLTQSGRIGVRLLTPLARAIEWPVEQLERLTGKLSGPTAAGTLETLNESQAGGGDLPRGKWGAAAEGMSGIVGQILPFIGTGITKGKDLVQILLRGPAALNLPLQASGAAGKVVGGFADTIPAQIAGYTALQNLSNVGRPAAEGGQTGSQYALSVARSPLDMAIAVGNGVVGVAELIAHASDAKPADVLQSFQKVEPLGMIIGLSVAHRIASNPGMAERFLERWKSEGLSRRDMSNFPEYEKSSVAQRDQLAEMVEKLIGAKREAIRSGQGPVALTDAQRAELRQGVPAEDTGKIALAPPARGIAELPLKAGSVDQAANVPDEGGGGIPLEPETKLGGGADVKDTSRMPQPSEPVTKLRPTQEINETVDRLGAALDAKGVSLPQFDAQLRRLGTVRAIYDKFDGNSDAAQYARARAEQMRLANEIGSVEPVAGGWTVAPAPEAPYESPIRKSPAPKEKLKLGARRPLPPAALPGGGRVQGFENFPLAGEGEPNAQQNSQAAQPDGHVLNPQGPRQGQVPAESGGAGIPQGGQGEEVRQEGPIQVGTGLGPLFGSSADWLKKTFGGGKLERFVKSFSRASAPITAAADGPTGEALVRAAAAPVAGVEQGLAAAANTLGRGGITDKALNERIGKVYREENLRGVRRGWQDALAKADADLAAAPPGTPAHDAAFKARQAAARGLAGVRPSYVGSAKDAEWPNEADYEKDVKAIENEGYVAAHRGGAEQQLEAQHRLATRNPTGPLPDRSPRIGFQHLKGLDADEEPLYPGTPGAYGNPQNLLRKRSVFGQRATGKSPTYSANYTEQVVNGFAKEAAAAAQNDLYDTAIRRGMAVPIDGPRATMPLIQGEPTSAVQIQRGKYSGEWIAVQKVQLGEWKRALRTTFADELPEVVKSIQSGLTRVSLGLGAEAVPHTANMIGVIQNTPGREGSLLRQAAEKAGGPARLAFDAQEVETTVRDYRAGDPDAMRRSAGLAKIGAGRPRRLGEALSEPAFHNRVEKWIWERDNAMRIIMDKRFDAGVKEGRFTDTETNRREFVNQLGQYITELQPFVVRQLRWLGLNPFATATYWHTINGIRRIMPFMSDLPIERNSNAASVAAKLGIYANMLNYAATAAAINYGISGHAQGRPGTPFGMIDTGKDYADGKHVLVDLFGLGGFRRGLSASGLGRIERQRWSDKTGETWGQTMNEGRIDIQNAILSPALGPTVRAMWTMATGRSAGFRGRQLAEPVPHDHDFEGAVNNIKAALVELNPMGAATFGDEPGTEGTAGKLRRLLPTIIKTGSSPEQMKSSREAANYVEDEDYIRQMARRIKELPKEQREKAYLDAIGRMSPESQARLLKRIQSSGRGIGASLIEQ